ncbi:MAG: hypothetical protein IPL65_01500 [Lewinellaceae bacterium]|nr:hypothetical protein [Lewinellaceae bacterium]
MRPSRNLDLTKRTENANVATTPGSSAIDGGGVNVKGSRSNATNYYIDGVRVTGGVPAGRESAKEKDRERPASPAKPTPALKPVTAPPAKMPPPPPPVQVEGKKSKSSSIILITSMLVRQTVSPLPCIRSWAPVPGVRSTAC